MIKLLMRWPWGDPCDDPSDCGEQIGICSSANICQDGGPGDSCASEGDCDADKGMVCGDGFMCAEPAAPPGDPVEGFADGFDGDALGDAWTSSKVGDGCSISTPDSRIQFSMNGQVGRCEVTTVHVYDLTDGSVDLDIPAITNYYTPMRVFLAVVDEDGSRIELAFHNGYFEGTAEVGSATVFSETSAYKPEPRFWRIRHGESQVFLESSITGSSWDIEMQLDTPFYLSRVRFSFGVEVLDTMPGSVGIGVPGFNTAGG